MEVYLKGVRARTEYHSTALNSLIWVHLLETGFRVLALKALTAYLVG